MPDVDTRLNSPGQTDDIFVVIDDNNNDLTRYFALENDGGGFSHRQLMIRETGDIYVYGPLQRAGTMELASRLLGQDSCKFVSRGVTVATIENNGRGDFSAGGLNLAVLSDSPNVLGLTGTYGDLVMWHDVANSKFRLMAWGPGNIWSPA